MGERSPLSRRALVRRAGLAVAAAAALPTEALAAPDRCDRRRAPIAQPAHPSPRAFMRRAEALRDRAVRDGDQAYGAVVVLGGRIVGLGPSRVVVDGDPTAHAELVAIRDATARLGRRALTGAELYATSRPCAMCETAAYWADVARIVVGTRLADAGPPRYGGR